jgi:hypothetical protein
VIVAIKVLAWKALTLISEDKLDVIWIKAKVSYFKASRILSVLDGREGLIYS